MIEQIIMKIDIRQYNRIDVFYNKTKIGKILIEQPYPFGLLKVIDPNVEEFENKELLANNKKCRILKSV